MPKEQNLPIRTRNQRLGDQAHREFANQIRPSWIANRSESDFGWDELITLTDEGSGRVGDEFFVQVKGSTRLRKLRDMTECSLPLEVSTLNWLMRKTVPTIVAVCDLTARQKPIYWQWVDVAVKQLNQSHPKWTQRRTATIRIPLANVLKKTSKQLEAEVRRRSQENRIGKQVYEFLAPTFQLPPTTDTLGASEYVEQVIVPQAQTMFGLEVEYKPTGPKARVRDAKMKELAEKLRAAATFLNDMQPRRASQLLGDIEGLISTSDSANQADYYNCSGVVKLHEGDFLTALSSFRKAAELRPTTIKYRVNALSAEYLVVRSQSDQAPLSAEWRKHLEALLEEAPDSVQLTRIKLHVMAQEAPSDFGPLEEYLKKVPLWNTDRSQALALLAEASMHSRDPFVALKAMEEAEAAGLQLDAQLYSLKGYIYLRRAHGDENIPQSLNVTGFGANELDSTFLLKAFEAYQQSVRHFAARGYPPSAEESFHNAATVSMLVGDASLAERICREFLRLNPRSTRVEGALALALMHLGAPMKALPFAKSAYSNNPNDGTLFHNFVLLLLQAREYDSLLEEVANREAVGFLSQNEERFARQLAAVAYAEIGEDRLSSRQVDLIRTKLGDPAAAASTEIRVKGIQGVARNELLAQAEAYAATYPDSVLVLETVILVLRPLSISTAQRIAAYLERISTRRQLGPSEISLLGRAFLLSRSFTLAEAIFRSGRARFPTHTEFVFEHALALAELDEVEASTSAIEEYVKLAGRNYETYSSLGLLAAKTGRLSEAIDAFHRALNQTEDADERAKLHLQLYELKRLRSDPARERLRHAMEYGKATQGDPEAEARFLTMVLLVPLNEEDFLDPEVAATKEPIATRLKAFCDEHPHFQGLLRISIPEGLEGLELYNFFASETAAIFLPATLHGQRAELAFRSIPWPLQSRASVVRPSKSVFAYFEECMLSSDFAHAQHVLHPPLDIELELKAVNLDRPVCCDLATLLLLDELSLLQDVLELFPRIYVPSSTRLVLELELAGFEEPHSRAMRLKQLIARNRQKVRFRQIEGQAPSAASKERFVLDRGLWVTKKEILSRQLGLTGDAILVADQLGIPLYSDESVLRYLARTELGNLTFGTVALLMYLRTLGRLTLQDEAGLLSKLIKRNCRYVPFLAEHLHSRLRSIVHAEEFKERPPGKDDLHRDEVLGVFLLEFGNASLSVKWLLAIAIRWFAVLCWKQQVPSETLVPLVATVSWKLVHRDLGGVLTGIPRDEPRQKLAMIFAGLLHATFQTGGSLEWIWGIIKSAAENIYPREEKTYEDVTFSRVPTLLVKIIEAEPEMNSEQKVESIVRMTQQLPYSDRERFEAVVIRAATWMHG